MRPCTMGSLDKRRTLLLSTLFRTNTKRAQKLGPFLLPKPATIAINTTVYYGKLMNIRYLVFLITFIGIGVTRSDMGNCTNSCANTCNTSCGDCCDDSNVALCPHSCSTNCPSCTGCQSCSSELISRSADSNTVLLFGAPWMHQPNLGCCYGGLQGALEYQQTFNSCALAQCLLGKSTLTFKGSQVADRTSQDIVADYFGLPTTFDGSLTLAPYIWQINLHGVAYCGFDRWAPGLYAKLDVTFSHQWRTLGAQQCMISTQTGIFPAGYMGAQEALAAPDLCTALDGNFLFGDMQTPWEFGKFCFGNRSRTGVAGVSLNIGYDFLLHPSYYFGGFFRVTAPTGTRVHQQYFFDALVGNGHHWEVGAGMSGGWELLNYNKCHELRMLLDGYVTTLLSNHQLRSFDLISNGTGSSSCLSRYTLLKQLTGSTGAYEYEGSLIPAINFTTRKVTSEVAIKGDATLRLIYTHNDRFAFTCGYNIYGNTQEKISCVQDACNLSGIFARKGCQGTDYLSYTLSNTTVGPITITSGPVTIGLNSSVSGATAYNCNTGIDNPVAVPGGPAQTAHLLVTWNSNNNNESLVVGQNIATAAGTLVTPFTSQDPVIVTDRDLNLCSARAPRQLTHKGFVMFDCLWDRNWLHPYLGVGAEVEGNSGSCEVNQWGIFIKGGLSY